LSLLAYLKQMFCTAIENMVEDWELVLSMFVLSFVILFFANIYLT
jgi:hypothetical protein